MKTIINQLSFVFFFLLVHLHGWGQSTGSRQHLEKIAQELGKTSNSIAFIENKGQLHDQFNNSRPDVLFASNVENFHLFLRKTGTSYQLNQALNYKEATNTRTNQTEKRVNERSVHRVDIEWLDCRSDYKISHNQPLSKINNYYLAHCPNGITDVKTYSGVVYENLYADIDLHYYQQNDQLKYDFIVAPGANYKSIRLQVTGAEIIQNTDGSIQLKTAIGTILEGKPIVFQRGKPLNARWLIENNVLSFEIEDYDPAYELIIDPVTRSWGTYYGSSSNDLGTACVADSSGCVYLTGYTDGQGGPLTITSGSHQTVVGGLDDAFLVKFHPDGSVIWATYYGGEGMDRGQGIGVDPAGNVFLCGFTENSLSAIATPGAHQTVNNGLGDSFLVKFNSQGVRQWGTYCGGNSSEESYSCSTDSFGNVYLTGYTYTTDGVGLVTPGCHQFTFGGGNNDGFVVKFNANGVRQWGTYYGGNSNDYIYSSSTDFSGNVYFVGGTLSSNAMATVGSHQANFSNNLDGFLVKFNPSGIRQWGTYYGGGLVDVLTSTSFDPNGYIYLAGYTETGGSSTIATSGSHQDTYNGTQDAFLVKFNLNGVRQWGTYYGGTSGDFGNGCCADQLGNVYLCGKSYSTNSIATAGTPQTTNNGGYGDAFVVKFDANGVRQWGSFYGGNDNEYGVDEALGCAAIGKQTVYFCGFTQTMTGTIVASTGSFQSTHAGGINDGFLAKFSECTATFSTQTTSSCDSYLWPINNKVYTTSGIYTALITNATGCDSVVTLYLTIKNSSSSTDVITACNSYRWIDGITYTASNNTATFTLTNAVGCDSIIALNLTINSVTDLSTSVNGITLSANNPNANYLWLDCANNYSPISGQTGQSYTPNANGTYAVQLTQNGCVDTTNCVVISTIGILENGFGDVLTVFPNPTTGNFSIDLGSNCNHTRIELRDASGRLLETFYSENTQLIVLALDKPAGVYFIAIQADDKQALIRVINE
jgi:hypothetical protein